MYSRGYIGGRSRRRSPCLERALKAQTVRQRKTQMLAIAR
nr:MAG TPA: hypothetical protein [Microviridae sp.]